MSKIRQIKEVFPGEYGDGFLFSCLSHFSMNAERTIHELLENKLPVNLLQLKRDMTLEEYKAGKILLNHRSIRDRCDYLLLFRIFTLLGTNSNLVNRISIFDNVFDLKSGRSMFIQFLYEYALLPLLT